MQDTFFNQHHDRALIVQALTYYFNGVSMQKVSDMICDLTGQKISKMQVYRWLVKYSQLASDWASRLEPDVGVTWVADETVIKVRPRKPEHVTANWWLWDIIDTETRYLLATHFSRTRTQKSATIFLTEAMNVAGFVPDVLLTDKLNIYPKIVKEVFGGETDHQQSKGFASDTNTNLIERFHGTVKQRTKIMRHFKLAESASAILAGWVVHYNFFGRHQHLEGQTPADRAGISNGIRNWADLLEQAVPSIKELGSIALPRGCLRCVNTDEWQHGGHQHD